MRKLRYFRSVHRWSTSTITVLIVTVALLDATRVFRVARALGMAVDALSVQKGKLVTTELKLHNTLWFHLD